MSEAADLIARARDLRGRGDHEAAVEQQSKAVDILRREASPRVLAHAVRHLADMAEEAGARDLAIASIDEAMALYDADEAVDALEYANALRTRAVVSESFADKERAVADWQRARDAYAAIDDRFAALGMKGNPGVAEADDRLAALGA